MTTHLRWPVPPLITRSERIGIIIVEMAREDFAGLTRRGIAKRAEVSEPLVTHYFGSIEAIKSNVMSQAIKRGDLKILALGLGSQNPLAQGAPLELREKAAALLV